MKAFLQGTLVVTLSGFALAIVGCGGGGGGDVPAESFPSAVVPPLSLPGPYTVACSNVAQDFSRVAPREDAKSYWEGSPSAIGSR